MMSKVVFNWSDAWLLLGILFASKDGPANLSAIINSCDGINMAVLEPNELESGLVRLTEAGFVKEEQGYFYASGKAQKLKEELTKRRNVFARLKDVEDLLGAPAAGAAQPSLNNLRYPGFAPEYFAKAIENYVDEVN